MKKRLLAMLLVLAMALSLMPPITVSAASGADYREDYAQVIADANAMTFPKDGVSTMTAYCPACGAEDAVWQPLTQEVANATITGEQHYYLFSDITQTTLNYGIQNDGTLCLHLNGKNISFTTLHQPNTAIYNCSSFAKEINVMGSGNVQNTAYNWATVANNKPSGTVNLYGGTYKNLHGNTGNTIDAKVGTIKLYGATVENPPGTRTGKALSGTGVLTIVGGTVPEAVCNADNGTLNIAGGTVDLVSASYGTTNITGGTVNKLVAGENATAINVSGAAVIKDMDLSATDVKLTVGTLTEGAKINLGNRTGVFTMPFASKPAAEAAIKYFETTTGETITVNDDLCLSLGRDAYRVGYSKVDINPYADGTGEDQTLLELPMAGFGDNATRLSLADKLDDNGDGKVDANDGIFVTCTAITDKEGNTALLFTADLLWGYGGNFGPAVMEALLGEEFAEYGLDESRIFFNGSHNHFAPDLTADEDANDAQKQFNQILKTQFVEAARQALADRAWADMYRSSVDVVDYFKDSTHKEEEKVGDLLNDMRGETVVTEQSYADIVGDNDVFFTCTRHYLITEQRIKTNADGSPMVDSDRSPYLYVLDETAEPVTYYAGNGFNGDWKGVNFLHYVYEYDEETGIVYDGTNDTDKRVNEIRVVTNWEEATPTDDTLRMVEFRFASDSGKDPVVMINWRGHLPTNSGLFGKDENNVNIVTPYKTVSGGMVNALRNAMAYKGYRAAFLQGQTGNINMEHLGTEGSWMKVDTREKCNIFGTELAQLALYAMEDAQKVNEEGGEIKSTRQIYQADFPHPTAFEYLAAIRYKKAYAANGDKDIGLRVYKDFYYYTDAEGNPLIDTESAQLKTDENGNAVVNPKSGENYKDANGNDVVGVTKHTSGDWVIAISSLGEANRRDSNYKHRITTGEMYEDVALHALTIGDEFKLTSVAAEIFDHYIGEEGENLWDTLKEEHNDPFVLGVTNNYVGGGYMPDKNTYYYAASDNEPTYVVGTYESNGTPYAEGTGEAIVGQLDIMLDFLGSDHPAGDNLDGKCEHCNKDVTWIDLSREASDGALRFENQMQSGHYYLPEGKSATLTNIKIPDGVEVCIDLNGQTLNVYRAIMIEDGGKLTIMDSKDTGYVLGYEAYYKGGMFNIAQGGEMTVYGGSFLYKGEQCPSQASGGIIYVSGKFTMYDGYIEGTTVSFMGGTMVIEKTGEAFFRGGTIKEGAISEVKSQANGKGITATGQVTLAGDANIDNLFFINGAANIATMRMHIDGVFTGSAGVSGMPMETEIGVASNNADITLGYIRQYQGYIPHIVDGQVIMKKETDYVAKTPTGEFIYGDYTADANAVDLNTVLQTLPDGSRVVMMKNTTTAFSVQQNLQWELKGFTLNSAITVAEGKSIQFTDCKGTGKVALAKVNGKITYAPASEDGKTVYVPIPGTDGLATLQEARINIDQMVLRAEAQDEETGKATPGLYFKHRFDGDETVKAQVEYYGIAFSLVGEPTAADLQAEGTLVYEDSVVYRAGDVVYTKLDGTGFGQKNAEATSTVITGIMKEGNGVDTNKRNAAMAIYGTAYVKLKDGTFILGENGVRSLQQQVEEIDEQMWNQLKHGQRRTMLRMYKNSAFTSVINKWETPNLKDPTKSQTTEEQDTLRILAIGNSHTVDATNLLYQVFEDQKTEQGMYETEQGTYKTVMIGNMYYSGCTVWNHVNFARQDAPVYQYYTYSAEGNSVTKETTLEEALHDQIWDIIILHEMNGSAAVESTYTGANQLDLQRHINYVKANSLNGDPKLIWNFSWANPTSQTLWDLGYPKGDTYNWVEDYKADFGPDLETMYDNMLEAMKANTKKYVMTNPAFSGTNVIPTGLAIQYARNELGQTDDVLYRDYTHVSDFGRLMTSYLWFASIAGKTEIDVGIDKVEAKFREEKSRSLGDLEVTEDMQSIIERSVKYAISQKGTLLPE